MTIPRILEQGVEETQQQQEFLNLQIHVFKIPQVGSPVSGIIFFFQEETESHSLKVAIEWVMAMRQSPQLEEKE